MEGVSIIPASDFVTTEWSGGTTTELFICPEGASYKERRFEARISTAYVELDESTFTRLDGVKRFLTPLCPGFTLTVNGRTRELPFGDILEFSGEDDVKCVGKGRDLNLMLKGVDGKMSIVSGAFTVSACAHAFVFAVDTLSLAFCGGDKCTSLLLSKHDCAGLNAGSYSSDGSLVLFTIG